MFGVRNRVKVRVMVGVRTSFSIRVRKKLVISPLECMQNHLYVIYILCQ